MTDVSPTTSHAEPPDLVRMAGNGMECSRADFPSTRWSLVRAAGEEQARGALTWLCERYWFPLFAYARGKGHSREDSEDLVQGFFTKLMEENMVDRAEMGRGRFRSFLLGCLNRHMISEWRTATRLKRGGGAQLIALDGEEADGRLALEGRSQESPEEGYDRAWALTLLDRVTETVREECEAGGNTGRFAVLKSFLHGARGEVSLAAAAESLGVTVGAVKSIVHRLRRRFRERLLAEIRETVSSEEEVDQELRHLFASVSS